MYNILKMGDCRVNGRKFGTHSPMNCICRVLFMTDSLSSLWGHSVYLARLPMWRFSKGYCSHSFHPFSTKLYGKYGHQGGIQAITFWPSAKFTKKNYGTLKFLLTQNHVVLEISKCYSPVVFIWFQPNFMRTLAIIMECSLLLFLEIGRVLKLLWHFEILACESMGKS